MELLDDDGYELTSGAANALGMRLEGAAEMLVGVMALFRREYSLLDSTQEYGFEPCRVDGCVGVQVRFGDIYRQFTPICSLTNQDVEFCCIHDVYFHGTDCPCAEPFHDCDGNLLNEFTSVASAVLEALCCAPSPREAYEAQKRRKRLFQLQRMIANDAALAGRLLLACHCMGCIVVMQSNIAGWRRASRRLNRVKEALK